MNFADAIFLVQKERHTNSTDCTTNHASSIYWHPRKQQRSLPMLFQPFQPSLMRVEKVEQHNQLETFFLPIEHKTTQRQPTQPT